MKNLTPYITDNIGKYDTIVAKKHSPRKERLQAMRNLINGRYNLYSTNFTPLQIHSIGQHGFTNEEKDDLLHCYSIPPIPFSELVTEIKSQQEFYLQGTCQYCGINSDSTIDHYLPEGDYPDYCIYPLNLIPCCPECNSNKSIFFYNHQLNSREIVNLYLDPLPAVQFLFMDLVYMNDIPVCNFYIDNRNNINAALFTLIDRHFFRLKLPERFKSKFAKEYTIILKSFKGKPHFNNNHALVTATLLEDSNTLYLDHGFNYWRRIMRIALASNQAFLNIATS